MDSGYLVAGDINSLNLLVVLVGICSKFLVSDVERALLGS